jgi:NTE family protein
MASQTILVLGGGNALGAYLAGAYEEIDARGIRPDWLIGASIGALTGAILAGNPPERRLERLREFWSEAATRTGLPEFGDTHMRQLTKGAHAAWAALIGRPTIFGHRWPGLWSALPGTPNDIAIYDHRPLLATLSRLVDFGRLNGGETRLSVGTIDIETGREVVFDTARETIRPEHLLASAAITPAFPPVEIDGRMLCDPGYVNNTPIDVALVDPPDRDTLCIAIELFGLRSPRPASLDAVLERTQDLLFASPTRRTIAALRREYALHARLQPDMPRVTLAHLAYQAPADELAVKTLDFSPGSLRERWSVGRQDLAEVLDRAAAGEAGPGLTYVSRHA